VRYQGRITEWNDDRGFGFVTPDGGGQRVFIHIKSFSNRQRRPMGNEMLTYKLTVDDRGRPQGVNIAFVGDGSLAETTSEPGPGVGAMALAALVLVVVSVAVVMGRLPFFFLILYLVSSCLAYLAYLFDKAAALQGKWRTSEQTLHLLSLIGGWPGAVLAQRAHRHKTQKQSFQLTFRTTVILNCLVLAWMISPLGLSTIQL
jgi:uncharacterized membrane protein YsdA (DUF1294 family)/cold shock CspA family protein